MTMQLTGVATGGKPINLSQLQGELEAAGVDCSPGLGSSDDLVYTYAADGTPADFPTADQPTVDQVIAEHVGMRDRTDAEYAEEFQNPATTPERKQEIRDITAGLMPREQVPM
jgi:hypothetical protein